jgi:hypothetical protein
MTGDRSVVRQAGPFLFKAAARVQMTIRRATPNRNDRGRNPPCRGPCAEAASSCGCTSGRSPPRSSSCLRRHLSCMRGEGLLVTMPTNCCTDNRRSRHSATSVAPSSGSSRSKTGKVSFFRSLFSFFFPSCSVNAARRNRSPSLRRTAKPANRRHLGGPPAVPIRWLRG